MIIDDDDQHNEMMKWSKTTVQNWTIVIDEKNLIIYNIITMIILQLIG